MPEAQVLLLALINRNKLYETITKSIHNRVRDGQNKIGGLWRANHAQSPQRMAFATNRKRGVHFRFHERLP